MIRLLPPPILTSTGAGGLWRAQRHGQDTVIGDTRRRLGRAVKPSSVAAAPHPRKLASTASTTNAWTAPTYRPLHETTPPLQAVEADVGLHPQVH